MPLDDSELILHIGGAKCGSSAIQAYLRQNAETLIDRNVVVPGKALDFFSEVTGEQIWAFEDAAASTESTEGLAGKLTHLFEKADERGTGKIVLSAENICNHASLAPVLAHACGNRPVKVVFYVRRQDDFLISGWQQWHLKVFDTVEAYLADRVGRVACWHSMIEPWAEALGDDNIKVRPFVREHLKNQDVVADFCDVIGIDQTGLTPLPRTANPSFDEALARLAHRVRDVFDGPHDNRFYETMVRLLGANALKKDSASSLLTLETRHHILARYAEENELLKNRFLPELGETPLFKLPSEKNVRDLSEEKKLSDDIAMLTRCVYALAEKCDKAL